MGSHLTQKLHLLVVVDLLQALHQAAILLPAQLRLLGQELLACSQPPEKEREAGT